MHAENESEDELKPVVYRTKRDIALELVRKEIISGELAPGTRLTLDDLAQKFNLSMTPIREALPVLEGEGFIIQLPHRGAIVAPMDREEILELYAIRIGMERMVTKQAVPKLTPRHLAEMADLIEQMEKLEGEWDRFLECDKSFHVVLYEAAGSSRWLKMIETLWYRASRYMIASTAMSGAIARVYTDHQSLLDACSEGDADRAASIISEHLHNGQERLLREW